MDAEAPRTLLYRAMPPKTVTFRIVCVSPRGMIIILWVTYLILTRVRSGEGADRLQEA